VNRGVAESFAASDRLVIGYSAHVALSQGKFKTLGNSSNLGGDASGEIKLDKGIHSTANAPHFLAVYFLAGCQVSNL